MKSSSKKAQALNEFLLVLPLLGTLLLLVLYVGVEAGLRYLLHVDLYDLARAHLYGNDLHLCEASRLWPKSLFDVTVNCLEIPTHYFAKLDILWDKRSFPFVEVHSIFGRAQ